MPGLAGCSCSRGFQPEFELLGLVHLFSESESRQIFQCLEITARRGQIPVEINPRESFSDRQHLQNGLKGREEYWLVVNPGLSQHLSGRLEGASAAQMGGVVQSIDHAARSIWR